ncbi:hypothetical protein V3C99_011531, partial [Haemonchus contortus]
SHLLTFVTTPFSIVNQSLMCPVSLPMWIGVLTLSSLTACNRRSFRRNRSPVKPAKVVRRIFKKPAVSRSRESTTTVSKERSKRVIHSTPKASISSSHEAVEPRVKTSHEAVQARVKKKVEEKVIDTHPPPEIRPLPESPKEVLYTARKFTSSFVDEPLRIQRTQHASDESIHDKFEQNQARRNRTEDDGTYLDAPSLQRADTSVDSDLGSLRDAVKELVNIRDNISKRQTTSGESIIGDHSSPSGRSDTGDTLLIEKAEEAAYEFEKKHPKKTEATKSESERRKKSSFLPVRKKHSKEAKEEHSHKKIADGKKSKQGTVGGNKDTAYEKHNLKYSLCPTQKSAYTMDTEPSSPRIVHKKAQGQPARKKSSTTSTHFMQVIRRKGS